MVASAGATTGQNGRTGAAHGAHKRSQCFLDSLKLHPASFIAYFDLLRLDVERPGGEFLSGFSTQAGIRTASQLNRTGDIRGVAFLCCGGLIVAEDIEVLPVSGT